MGKSKQFILYYRAAKAFLFFVRRAFIGRYSSIVKKNVPVDNINVDNINVDEIKAKMFDFWRKELHFSESTCEYRANNIFNYSHYLSIMKEIKQRFGDLRGLRVLDAGCGWGTLSVLLQKEGVQLTSIDYVPAHLEVTRQRLEGQGDGFCADLRNLQNIIKDNSYDIVVSHAVIEHIGNFRDDRRSGDAKETLNDKLTFVKELYRVLKPGGRAFISTGNYDYFVDGEVRICCFQWLPDKYQKEILKDIGLDASDYGLLKWTEFEKLFLDAGFQISDIVKLDVDVVKNLLHLLAPVISVFIPNFTPKLVDVLLHMLEYEPIAMPAWNVFLTKPNI
ncbi:MAG: methyltransferase domain-containing protein [Candidatus Magnetoovum sp. WYHC-5]|nr:methyltransferase domain-containing protein [Candidatus Magnetoovum sp. WYHC-5]